MLEVTRGERDPDGLREEIREEFKEEMGLE